MKKMERICLHKGEKIILRAQGTFQSYISWKLGHLFLTNRRLLFIHITEQALEISLDDIIDMSIMKRPWLMGVRVKQLCIHFNHGKGQERAYIALVENEKWIDLIKENMTIMLAERWGDDGAKQEPPCDT